MKKIILVVYLLSLSLGFGSDIFPLFEHHIHNIIVDKEQGQPSTYGIIWKENKVPSHVTLTIYKSTKREKIELSTILKIVEVEIYDVSNPHDPNADPFAAPEKGSKKIRSEFRSVIQIDPHIAKRTGLRLHPGIQAINNDTLEELIEHFKAKS